MERLVQQAERGFSPTALKAYCQCPVQFYYSYLLGLRDNRELEDDIDSSLMGTAVHAVLEEVYTPYIGRRVEADGLREALQRLPSLLQAQFEPLLSHGRNGEGRNHLMQQVAESQLRAMLKKEIAVASDPSQALEIVALEKEDLQHTLPHEGEGTWRIAGRVDRIDRCGGLLRVIDYKTGSLYDKELNYKTEQGLSFPEKWIQLMCYALIYYSCAKPSEPMETAIYPLRYPASKGVQLATWDNEPTLDAERIGRFEELLSELIGSLMNPAQPFVATPSSGACQYCPARTFCPESRATRRNY